MQALRVAQFLALGYANFGARGFRANEASFTKTALDVDLTGKNYIVTGATSGLGKVTARELARRGGTVHILCRDSGRGRAVQDSIIEETGNDKVQIHVCDISRLKDIASFSEKWVASDKPIAALVNNAGVMLHHRQKSEDGYEMGFATNTLGTFALTEMLLPALEKGGNSRVVTVSSAGMLTECLEKDDLEGTKLSKNDKIDGSAQYSRSKRHQVAITEYWARKYGSRGIFWASMHPGWAGTPGLEKAMPSFYNATKNQLRSQEQGADTIVYLAASEEALSYTSGDFFFDRKPAVKHLWLGGTGYSIDDVDCLVSRLRSIVAERKHSLPE